MRAQAKDASGFGKSARGGDGEGDVGCTEAADPTDLSVIHGFDADTSSACWPFPTEMRNPGVAEV